LSPGQLQISGLRWAWPGQAPLFDGWQASLAPGLHWLQAEPGGGKTTLLRWLAGAADSHGAAQHAGQVLLDGMPLARQGQGNSQHRIGCAWLNARDPAWDTLTPAALRDHLRRQHPGLNDADWQRHISGFSLAEHGFKTLHMLSTGMRHKAALAAVLASGAPVLLLDEPCAGLDAPSVAWLVGALQALVAQQDRWLLLAAGDWPPGLTPGATLAVGQAGPQPWPDASV